jgi:hypothetical protein
MLYGEEELRKAKGKYNIHKENSKRRGIEFLLSFNEWYDFWLQSCHWHERGTKKGQYVMARHNDIGPYQLGNISIITNAENTRSASLGIKSCNFKGSIKGTCLITGKEIILNGVEEMEILGFQSRLIYKCISGNRKTHKNHKWERI